MKTMLLRETELKFKKGKKVSDINIKSSYDCYKMLKDIYGDDIDISEAFVAIFVDNNSNVVGWQKIAQGGITMCIVDIRLLFSAALNCLATHILISHNHPSGKLVASMEDKNITNKIKEAGELLQIKLLDHIIITENGYLSFADEGMI